MTIDDFDLNEISDKLAVREEADNVHTLEAAHDDAHNDYSIIGCIHQDMSNSPWHNDNVECDHHDNGHYDIFDDCCATHDDACPGYKQCPE